MLNKDNRMYIILLSIFFIFNINTVEARTIYANLLNNHEITAKYEHGGKGYQAIGKDSYKGYSYGKWQISTERRNNKPSTFDFFLKYLKEKAPVFYTELHKAGGQEKAFSGDVNFRKTWKKLALDKDFQQSYDNFIFDTQVIPVYTRLDNSDNIKLDKLTTWSSENKAIQAAIKSTIIQHGSNGAFNMLSKIMLNKNVNNKDIFLKKLYEYRIFRFPRYKKRYLAEYNDLKNYLNSEKSKIETKYANLLKIPT